MVSDTVFGALVGGSLAVLGSGVTATINYYRTKKQLETENERRHAEFFLDRKVELLSDVHVNLTTAKESIGEALQNPSAYSWSRIEEEILPKIESLQQSISISSIFLNNDQEMVLRQAVDDYYTLADEIAILEFGTRGHQNDLLETTDQAQETLASEINEPIQRFEQSEGHDQDELISQTEPNSISYRDGGEERQVLARQKSRIRDVLRLNPDGDVEFLHQSIGADGKALLWMIGRRYSYEGYLVESASVDEQELKARFFSGSDTATGIFLRDAEPFIREVDEDEYTVPIENVPDAIDWAMNYVSGLDSDE